MTTKGTERAWEAFIGPLSSINRRQCVRAGDSAGIRKEDERSRIAVGHRLLVVGNAKYRCISASKLAVFFFLHLPLSNNSSSSPTDVSDERTSMAPIRGALLKMEYTKALAGLNDFESLLTDRQIAEARD